VALFADRNYEAKPDTPRQKEMREAAEKRYRNFLRKHPDFTLAQITQEIDIPEGESKKVESTNKSTKVPVPQEEKSSEAKPKKDKSQDVTNKKQERSAFDSESESKSDSESEENEETNAKTVVEEDDFFMSM
jgi:hypothetical protein